MENKKEEVKKEEVKKENGKKPVNKKQETNIILHNRDNINAQIIKILDPEKYTVFFSNSSTIRFLPNSMKDVFPMSETVKAPIMHFEIKIPKKKAIKVKFVAYDVLDEKNKEWLKKISEDSSLFSFHNLELIEEAKKSTESKLESVDLISKELYRLNKSDKLIKINRKIEESLRRFLNEECGAVLKHFGIEKVEGE